MKKKWFKNIMKIIGISMASVFGFVALSIGVFALFGGFNEKIVKLQGMRFEQTAYVIDGNIHGENGIFDDTIKILPTNEDANQLDVTLSGGANIVTLPTGKDSKVNKNLNLKLTTITETDNTGTYTYNKGGDFTLNATQEKTLLTTSTKVFVESKVNSFNLTDNMNGGLIYPGSKFTVRETNVKPANAFNKPTANEFTSVYGESYFKKTFLYFSSNESIATVDIYTGEVEVLTEGNFTIFAYVPTTYKNNSLLPDRNSCNSDSEYFALLEAELNGLPFTIKSEIQYVSHPISVSGITASNNVFNLLVNEEYKYAVDGVYNVNDKQINLDFNLLAPQNSNYTSEQLSYKLQDIEIYEGYKENNHFYISAGQIFDEENQILKTTHFDIKQNKKPLYYTITARDYTYSKDLYLIARIANKKLDLNEISTNSILATDVPVEESEDYIYYAFVKVNTNIVETTALNLSTDKIMAAFTKENQDGNFLFTTNNAMLNLNDLVSEILPANSTYKNVRFYVRNNGAIDTPIILADSETGEIAYQIINEGEENEQSGYFVKALNEGTLQFYASIVKTDRNGENPVKLFNSKDITLIVTQEINLTNFSIELSDQDKYDADINKYLITKGNNLVITFNTDNLNGLKRAYQEGFFTVTSLTANRVAINVDLNNAILDEVSGLYKCTILLTATFEGETTITINFNGKDIEWIEEDDYEEIINQIPLRLAITNNDLKSINLISYDGAINSQNQINFEVNGDPTVKDLQFNVINTELTDINSKGTRPLNINIELNGGNDNTELLYYTSNNSDLELEIVDKVLKITPKKVCNDVEVYVYSMLGGTMIKSATYIINVSADYQIIPNRINKLNINSVEYEKVIGGDNFKLFGDNGFISILTGNNTKFNNDLFTIKSDIDNNGDYIYNDTSNSFIEVNKPTTCLITITPKFSDEVFNCYFYVVPKFTVVAESLEVATGSSIDLTTVINKIKLLENKYATSSDVNDFNNNLSKIGEIYTKEVTDTIEIDFYSDENRTQVIDNYTSSIFAFNNTTDIIYLSVKLNDQTYFGEMNVVIKSNIEIQTSNQYLNNGEKIELCNLFNITNTNGATISEMNVVFNENTFNTLKSSGINLLDEFDQPINSYLSSYRYDLTNKIYISLVKSLIVPEEFNILSLNDLSAYITCKINDDLTIQENHVFNLDFQITTIELDETNIVKTENGNTIYLETINQNVNYVSDNFVKFANIVNKNTDSPQNKPVTVEIDNNIATISLNHVKLYLNIETLTINKVLDNENNEILRYIGKAYSFEDLISINADLSMPYSYCIISTISLDGSVSKDQNYSIENNYLIIKEAGLYSISFNVLGNIATFEFNFNNLELENSLENSKISMAYKVYSNLTYDLFTLETLNILDTEKINYKVDVLKLDDTIYENSNITINNNKLQIGNYKQQSEKFKLKFTFNTTLNVNTETLSFTGAIKEVYLELNSLFITTNFSEVYDGRQVLMNNNNYDLSQYFTINSSDKSLFDNFNIDFTNFKFYINETELTNITKNSLIHTVNYSKVDFNANGLKDFDLIITKDDKEMALIPFSSEFVQLNITKYTSTTTPYFVGQTLNREDLLSIVKVLDINGNELIKYNNNIYFNDNLNNDFAITLTGSDITDKFTVKLGGIVLEDNIIESGTVDFIYSSLGIIIHPDTKVSNYISAKYQNKNLTLNYKADITNKYTVVDDEENNLQQFKDGDTLIATLNKINGELIVENIKNGPFEDIIITAYIVNAENAKQEISFAITEISSVISNVNPTIYIGDNTTDLRQFVCFENKNSEKTAYEFSDLIYTNNYTYYYNKNEIVKNGTVVASINANELTIKNPLDSMIVKVKAYVNVSSSSGYQLESLRNNDIEITINFVKMEVYLNNETISYNSANYFVLNTYNNHNEYLNKIIINPQSNLEQEISFNKFEFKSAFIGIVNDTIITKQYELSIEDTAKITLPTLEQITVIKEGNVYSLSVPKALSCYVFCTFNYKVDNYNNILNVVLKPNDEDIITFNYNNTTTPYKTIVSPSEYVLTNGSIFAFNNTEILKDISFYYLNKIEELNADYYLSHAQFSNPYKYEVASNGFVNTLTYSNTISGLKLTLETGTQAQNSNYYCIRITTNNDNYYYYLIKVDNLVIEIKDEQGIVNSVNQRIDLGSETNLDLKKYIYINDLVFEEALTNNPDYINNIVFNEISTDQYSVTSKGLFTPKSNIIGDVDISFTFYGITHKIYLKGQSIDIEFLYNNTNLNSDYILNNGNKYFVYITKIEEVETNLLNVNVSETTVYSDTLDGGLTVIDFEYSYGGQKYNDTNELFEIQQTANKTTVNFGGLTLLILENKNTYYELTLTENITGVLNFNLSVLYSGVISKKLVTITSDEIIISYIEPSIVSTQQIQREYQNMLSNTSLNLSNFVSGVTNKDKLNFELKEITSKVTLTSNGILTANDDIYSDLYLEIMVKYNNLQKSMFVRVIPEFKYEFASLNREFNVLGISDGQNLESEKVDLTNFAKAYKFNGVDSLNEPIYEQVYNYKFDDQVITNFNKYIFASEENIIEFNDFWELKFTVIVPDLSENYSVYVGESFDVKALILNKINTLTFNNVNISFVSADNFISEDGLLLANKAKTTFLKVLINNLEYELQVEILDLAIQVQYSQSVLLQVENVPTKFENVYSTQILDLQNFINVTSLDVPQDKELQIALKVLSSSGYEIDKFNHIISEDTINLIYEGSLLFSVNKEKLICFNNLSYETLIQLKLSIKNNNIIENVFNIRLLPVVISLSNGPQIEIDNSFFYNNNVDLLNNFVVCNSKAENSNLNLNDKLIFKTSVDTQTIKYCTKNLLSIEAFNLNNKISVVAILSDESNIQDGSIINENLAIKANFELLYTNESSQNNQYTPFNQSETTIISNGKISAVRNFIDSTNPSSNIFVVTTKIQEQTDIYYDVFNSEGENLIQINSNGTFVLKTAKAFKLTIEAFGMNQTSIITKSFNDGIINHTVDYNTIDCDINENGITVLEMISNSQLDITDFINGGTVLNECVGVLINKTVINGVTTYNLTANNVNKIAYGYFDVQFGSTNVTIQRVFVKIYPYQITKLYTEDFVYSVADVELNGNIAIKKDSSYKTILVSNNKIVNLNELVKLSTNFPTEEQLDLSVENIVAFNNSSYSFIDENNKSNYLEFNNNLLTLKGNGTYYVKIKATFNNNIEYLLFRVLEITDNTNNSINVTNGNILDLTKMINVFAQNDDAKYNGLPETKYNLFSNLDLNLLNNTNSYIENGYLYINEVKSQELTLSYGYENLINSFTINITPKVYPTGVILYNNNGINYIEKDHSNEQLNIGYISSVAQVNFNDNKYDITIEIVNEGTAQSPNNVKYYIVNNLIKISESGDVKFYDNLNIDSENNYISENNIGVIFVSVIKENNGILTQENYKFNNYSISYESSNYVYKENGQIKFGLLKCSLVNNLGLAISGSIITENKIIANGITLDVLTGEIIGTKLDNSIEMFVKVFVQENNYNFGEINRLFII